MRQMSDAISSPAWKDLDAWIRGGERRSVQLSFGWGAWTIGLYDHVKHSSGLVASYLVHGDPNQSFEEAVSRALHGVEADRIVTRENALAELEAIARGE